MGRMKDEDSVLCFERGRTYHDGAGLGKETAMEEETIGVMQIETTSS